MERELSVCLVVESTFCQFFLTLTDLNRFKKQFSSRATHSKTDKVLSLRILFIFRPLIIQTTSSFDLKNWYKWLYLNNFVWIKCFKAKVTNSNCFNINYELFNYWQIFPEQLRLVYQDRLGIWKWGASRKYGFHCFHQLQNGRKCANLEYRLFKDCRFNANHCET